MENQKQKYYIGQLMESTERELVNMMVQKWLYQNEVDHPTNTSKEQAIEGLKTYTVRVESLKSHLLIYQEYAKRL